MLRKGPSILPSHGPKLIGYAEMEKEIQKTVTKIIQSQENIEEEREVGIELDQNELRRYLDIVIKEVKKGERTPLSE